MVSLHLDFARCKPLLIFHHMNQLTFKWIIIISRVLLGLFDMSWSLVLLILVLISQFLLGLDIFLAPLYMAAGIGILFGWGWVRKFWLYAVSTMSVLASISFMVLASGIEESSAFYTPFTAQLGIIAVTIVLPYFINLVYLDRSRIMRLIRGKDGEGRG